MEQLHSPECGVYTSFGIAAYFASSGHHRKLQFIPDISTDPARVIHLADECTALQLEPAQLLDVVEDLLAE